MRYRGRANAYRGPPLEPADRRMLAVLQEEGRITNQALAARVNLSPSACLARLRRLERDGVIIGYCAQIAVDWLDSRLTAFAEITLAQHRPADFKHFEATIATIPEIVEAAEVSGSFDYLLKIAVEDIDGLRSLSDDMLSRDLGILKMNTHVLMKEVKRFTGWPILDTKINPV